MLRPLLPFDVLIQSLVLLSLQSRVTRAVELSGVCVMVIDFNDKHKRSFSTEDFSNRN